MLQNEYLFAYKQSRRREDDIAIVNAGMRVQLQEESGKWQVASCTLAYGGVAPVTKMAKHTMKVV